MNNQDSLRKQIIEAMNKYAHERGWADRSFEFNVEMFENAIMPVLDAAMKAGELLVHRATVPQKPVSQTIMDWLDGVCATVAKVRAEEKTASKRELLTLLYRMDEDAGRAGADARRVIKDINSEKTGRSLFGEITIPAKGKP